MPTSNLVWKLVAKTVSIPWVAAWLIRRAQKTPYFHLDGYMGRWWLFNGYGDDIACSEDVRHTKKYSWLPSIRVHHILREDFARDMHDHPWDARSIILKGSYTEERMLWYAESPETEGLYTIAIKDYERKAGDTATLKYGEYHNITSVSEGGVWTLFFTYDYKGYWGFFVDGKKVEHNLYNDEGRA